MLVGAVLGTTAYALAPISTEEETAPSIGTITTGDDIAQRQSEQISLPRTLHACLVAVYPRARAMGLRANHKRICQAMKIYYAFGNPGSVWRLPEGLRGSRRERRGSNLGAFSTKDFGPYIPGINS